MDPQIHGAIVGGALGGLTAAVAVGLDRWAHGRHEKRRELRAVARRLDTRTMSTLTEECISTKEGLPALYEEVISDMLEIKRLRTAFGPRRASTVQAAQRDLESLWMTVGLRLTTGSAPGVGSSELNALRVATRRLRDAVHGRRDAEDRLDEEATARFNKWLVGGADVDDLGDLPWTRREVLAYRWTCWRARREFDRARRQQRPPGGG
jgi:hypothetical protein